MVTAQRIVGEAAEMKWGYVQATVSIAVGCFLLTLIPPYSYDPNFVLFMTICAVICFLVGGLVAYATWDMQRMRPPDTRDMLR